MSFQKGHKQLNTGRTWFKKGYKQTEEHKKRAATSRVGIRRSKKAKRNMSKAQKGHFVSEEAKRKMSKSQTGKHHSKETINKIKRNHYDNSGKNHYNYGKKGKDSSNWQGGITPKNKRIRNSIKFQSWRNDIFTRDNWTCQKCKIKGIILHPHHIKNFAQHLKLRFAIDNGITFCKKCHILFHKIYGKKNNNQEQIDEFIL